MPIFANNVIIGGIEIEKKVVTKQPEVNITKPPVLHQRSDYASDMLGSVKTRHVHLKTRFRTTDGRHIKPSRKIEDFTSGKL
jgi:hypothetical protein